MSMKRKIASFLFICSGIATQSFASENSADTTFKKDNPNLLYTTKDFYIEVPTDCYNDNLCIQNFFLILTFNVGINGNNEIKRKVSGKYDQYVT